MKAHAVIGTGYGDEGKGLLTDYLAQSNSLVVRFNGGAQAGHTVVTPQGQRHVFKHLGAGTFRGASTLLSRFFIVNPILFNQERKLFPDAHVYVDPRAMVTTPFDMVLNQESEKIRRYGSVGVGINETVTRYQRGFPLTVSMLGPVRTLRAALAQIREEYYPRRASELGININRINTEAFIDRFILEAQNCDFRYIYDTELIKLYENVVFEGAQGLRLDECSPEFPHVTRSRTGSTNIVTLCKEAGISEIELHYVTRCYRTRHGNGPLEGELPSHPFNWVGEETNQDHEYQGKFRYAKLDPCMLVEDIFWDVMNWRRNSLRSIPKIAVTCLDQMPAEDSALLLKKIEGKGMAYGIELGHTSIGPTRECVYELCEQDGRRSDRSLQTSGNSSSHCS